MVNQKAFQADIKLIVREPILILFMALPLVIILVAKFFLVYGEPLLIQHADFDLAPYYHYILVLVLLMTPFMLGMVSGFLMIDDRDARIFELMSVTPLGFLGYVFIRVLIPFSASIVYTFVGYGILGIYPVQKELLILIALLNATAGVTVGLLLFNYAEDKVKAVALGKGLGILNILAVADLFGLGWLRVLAGFTPFYWVVRLVTVSASAYHLLMAVLVHVLWLGGMVYLLQRS